MAAGAPGHLDDQLRHALAGPEIGAEQSLIGVEYADQGDVWKVMALGEHLGAEQQPAVAGACTLQQGIEFTLAARGVPIDTQPLHIRKMFGQCLFDPFGALSLRV